MTDDQLREEGAEEEIEDLEAPAAAQSEVAGGRVIKCHLPTKANCQNPTCTGVTYCKGTRQQCVPGTCDVSLVMVQ